MSNNYNHSIQIFLFDNKCIIQPNTFNNLENIRLELMTEKDKKFIENTLRNVEQHEKNRSVDIRKHFETGCY
jgi:hypothetical protein